MSTCGEHICLCSQQYDRLWPSTMLGNLRTHWWPSLGSISVLYRSLGMKHSFQYFLLVSNIIITDYRSPHYHYHQIYLVYIYHMRSSPPLQWDILHTKNNELRFRTNHSWQLIICEINHSNKKRITPAMAFKASDICLVAIAQWL